MINQLFSRHLSNVFNSGELVRESVVAKNATTAADGKTYLVDFYNLDAVISVGYRVNSIRGTQFRICVSSYIQQLFEKRSFINFFYGHDKFWLKVEPKSDTVSADIITKDIRSPKANTTYPEYFLTWCCYEITTHLIVVFD